jgi:hypothetical protein
MDHIIDQQVSLNIWQYLTECVDLSVCTTEDVTLSCHSFLFV